LLLKGVITHFTCYFEDENEAAVPTKTTMHKDLRIKKVRSCHGSQQLRRQR
jgi:hypothetical protein